MKQLNLLKTLFLLCALVVGSLNSWAAEGDIHHFDQSLSQLLNNNAAISPISIPEQDYPIKGVRVSYRYNNTKTDAVTIEVTVAGTSWGTFNVNGTGSAYKMQQFNGETAKGAVTISFTNNTGDGTGHGTFYVDRVSLIEGSLDARPSVATIGDLNVSRLSYGADGTLVPTITPADGLSSSDYTVTWEEIDNDLILLTDAGEYVAGNVTGNVELTVTVSPVPSIEETYKPISKTFNVKIGYPFVNDGTEAKPFTVVEAKAFIDEGENLSETYHVKGVINEVTSFNDTYKSITYWISDDGLTKAFQCYSGKDKNGADFASKDDLKVGDLVVVKGVMKKNSSTYQFNYNNEIVSLTRKADPELAAVSATIDNMDATTSVAANTLYTVTSDGEISFSSNKEDVANVVAGTLYAYKPGTAKITVSVAETAAYAAGNVDITVTVTSKAAKDPEGPAAGSTYSLVTDAATLNAGDKLLFVDEGDGETGVAMSTTQNTNNRGEVAVTLSEHTISTVPATAQVITLEGSASGWYFNVGEGYLYAASSSSNHLKTEEEKDDNAKATISIAGNVATIVFQGTNTRDNLRYNASSSLFSCYASTSTLDKPSIYRQNVASTFDITIDSKGDGWRTIVTSASATLPSGLKAYIASADESDKVTLTEVASLKANNAYILYGTPANYTLTVTDSPAEPTGNELRVSTNADGNGAFVLAKKGGVVGFYKWNGGSLGAGRVILPASAVPDASARDFIGLGDATAISNVAVETKTDNRYYNLAGQVVDQPTKGLYIVNGKKVIIK